MNGAMATVAARLAPKSAARVAVFPFAERGAGATLLGEYVGDKLLVSLGSSDKVQLVERGRLDAVRAEQSLGASLEVDDATAASIGQLAGADAVVIGTLTNLGASWELAARLLDTSSGKILAVGEAQFGADSLPPGLAGVPSGSLASKAKMGTSAAGGGASAAIINENFASVAEGAVPDGWEVDDGLGVKREGRDKCLGVLKVQSHKIVLPAAKVPDDFRVELNALWNADGRTHQSMAINLGAVRGQFGGGYNSDCASITNASEVCGVTGAYHGKRTTFVLEKKGDVFQLKADGKSLVTSRIANARDLGSVPLVIEASDSNKQLCIYRVSLTPAE